MNKRSNSSWEGSADWYNQAVGEKGHYYHQRVIFPKLLDLLKLDSFPQARLIDLACGQGILCRQLPPRVSYVGVDLSPSLISAAEERCTRPDTSFVVADVSKPLDLPEGSFTHAVILLALQNIEKPQGALANAARLLNDQGKLFIVLNHPCFRIPRQSSWGVDLEKKIQYRRIDRYLTSLTIPIKTHPGQQDSKEETLSFHHALSTLSKFLYQEGFVIEQIEEWCSDKKSEGGRAKMEDLSRKEFPLFLTLVASKRTGR